MFKITLENIVYFRVPLNLENIAGSLIERLPTANFKSCPIPVRIRRLVCLRHGTR